MSFSFCPFDGDVDDVDASRRAQHEHATRRGSSVTDSVDFPLYVGVGP